MEKETKDSPGVIAPPPLIFLSGLLPGAAIQWFYQVNIFPPDYEVFAEIAGILLIIVGFAIVLTAIRKMHKAETNVEPWKPTTSILSDGIYAFSRNPIYVAMIVIYLGVASLFNAFWILLFLIYIVIVMHYGVILREEKYLEKKFGAEYLDYKKKVRRWI